MVPQTLSHCQRATPRQGVRIGAIIREPGSGRYQAEIIDLSTCGFCCEVMTSLAIGGRIFLHLPTFAPLEAVVAWRRNGLYGCKFAHPLHVAVFETIAARFPES